MFLNVQFAFSTITYEFHVLAINGTIDYKNKGVDEWKRLKIGDILDTAHIIRLSKNSYLGLVHKTGYTLELSQNKLYEVKSLVQRQNTKRTNAIDIIKFHILNLFDNNHGRDRNYRENMKSVATIERGLENVNLNEYPKYTRFTSTKVTFTWDKRRAKNINFKIFDENNHILLDTIINDSKIDVDLSKLKVNENQLYFWSIESKNSGFAENKVFKFIIIDKELRDEIQSELKNLSKNLNPKSPLDNLILAGFYDYHELYYDSYNTLKKIKQLAPNISFYSQYFEDWYMSKVK